LAARRPTKRKGRHGRSDRWFSAREYQNSCGHGPCRRREPYLLTYLLTPPARLRRAWPDRLHARSADQREPVLYALTTCGDWRLAHTALDREDGVRGTRRHRADVRLRQEHGPVGEIGPAHDVLDAVKDRCNSARGCARRERPCGSGAAEERDEIAPCRIEGRT
jgi:hypothetical protein